MENAMRTAVYAGSFDPPTKGHEWIIHNGAGIFDRLIVAIAVNPDKNYTFSSEERWDMLRDICSPFPNVQVMSMGNSLSAHFARRVEARYFLRGLRNEGDFRFEIDLRDENNKKNPDLESVLLYTPPDLRRVSSSFVKGYTKSDDWENAVKEHLPEKIYPKFVEKYGTIEKIKRLKERWLKLCYALGAIGDINDIFEEIIARYSESHRHYHGLDHILDCLEKLDQVRHFANRPLVLEMAIWTHDIVYDARPNANNEERSADLSNKLLTKLHLDPIFIAEVRERIMPTKHTYIPTGRDDCLIVDIDLASLALPPEEFDEMSEKIRQEYNIPVDIFRIGRAEFFKKLLESRPSIYLTEYFKTRYEVQAQENLKRVTAVLNK